MKKEVFLAVLVGFGLGLVITFGIWTANKNLKAIPSATNSSTPTPTITTNQDSQSPSPSNSATTLTITSPDQDELLVNSSSITLSGKTNAGNTVAITHENGQKLVTADASGEFTLQLTLEGGYNRITIVSFDAIGNSATKDLLVTYSTQKI